MQTVHYPWTPTCCAYTVNTNKLIIGVANVMHRSIAGYNPYNLFILTIDYSKNFTTNKVLTIGHMSMFVVKSIVIQINGLASGSINGRSKQLAGLNPPELSSAINNGKKMKFSEIINNSIKNINLR